MNFYLMKIIIFALFLTIDEILVNEAKCQNFDLENEGQYQGIEEWDLPFDWKCSILYRFFFQNFSYYPKLRLRER